MAENRNITTTESRGKRRGSDFDDRDIIQDIATAAIRQIEIRYECCVDAITVFYVGQTRFAKHGGDGGGKSHITLELDEFITKIEGVEHFDYYSISKLTFYSNKERKWGPYGNREASQKFTWHARADMGLLCFAGSASNLMGNLQATFASYPPGQPALPVRAVRYEIQNAEKDSVHDSVLVSGFAQNLMSSIVTLTVGEDRVDFHTNQDVLCRLPFFHAALHNGFRETTERKIRMPDDEPEIVAALIEFVAAGKYTYTYRPPPGIATHANMKPSPPCDLMEGLFHLRVYATASKYDCQGLAKAAMESLVDVLRQIDGIDVIQLLKETYLRGCDIDMLAKGGDMDAVKQRLPGIIRLVYATHGQKMKDIVFECPALANDFLRLSVAACS